MLKTLAVALTATSLVATAAAAGAISGAGATFPAPVYAKWAESYKAQTNNSLNYQSIGRAAARSRSSRRHRRFRRLR